MAEVISFRNPASFYAALPFGRDPVVSEDGSLTELPGKAGGAVKGFPDGNSNGTKELQNALNEFYRQDFLDLLSYLGGKEVIK